MELPPCMAPSKHHASQQSPRTRFGCRPPPNAPPLGLRDFHDDGDTPNIHWNKAVTMDSKHHEDEYVALAARKEDKKRELMKDLRAQIKSKEKRRAKEAAKSKAFEKALIENDQRNVEELAQRNVRARRIKQQYAENCHLVSLAVLAKRQEERDEERQAGFYKLWAHKSKDNRDAQLSDMFQERKGQMVEAGKRSKTARDSTQRFNDRAQEWQVQQGHANKMSELLKGQEEKRAADSARRQRRRELRYDRAVATANCQEAQSPRTKERLVEANAVAMSLQVPHLYGGGTVEDYSVSRQRTVHSHEARRRELDVSVERKRTEQLDASAKEYTSQRKDIDDSLGLFNQMVSAKRDRKRQVQLELQEVLTVQMQEKSARDRTDYNDTNVNPFRRRRHHQQ